MRRHALCTRCLSNAQKLSFAEQLLFGSGFGPPGQGLPARASSLLVNEQVDGVGETAVVAGLLAYGATSFWVMGNHLTKNGRMRDPMGSDAAVDMARVPAGVFSGRHVLLPASFLNYFLRRRF